MIPIVVKVSNWIGRLSKLGLLSLRNVNVVSLVQSQKIVKRKQRNALVNLATKELSVINVQKVIGFRLPQPANVKNAMTVIIAWTIKLEHATNQMVNVNAVVNLATMDLSVMIVQKVIGFHLANVKYVMSVIARSNIKKEHATNQMVNVNAVVELATKEISVKSVKKVIGCRQANVKNAMSVVIARSPIKLQHATNQTVNVNAVVKLATKEISVKSVKKIIGCRQANVKNAMFVIARKIKL